MLKICLIALLLNIWSVSTFKTSTCTHDQVISAVTAYSVCTVNAIKPLVQSLAMKAGDTVEESAIDKNCALLKKTGPIMQCANLGLGQCFSKEDFQNLKLAGQNSFLLLSMQCYSDETQMVVENDTFFSWLELENLSMDKDEKICTVETVDETNIAFQDCITNFKDEGENLLKDTKDIKKNEAMANN